MSRKWRRLCERRWRVWELAKRHVPAPCTNAARARYRPSLLAPIAPEGAASQPLTKTWGGKFALRSATCHGARSPPKMPAAKWQVSARMGRGGRAPFWHTVGRLFWGPRPEAEPPHVAGDASTQPRPEHRTGLTKMAARLPFFSAIQGPGRVGQKMATALREAVASLGAGQAPRAGSVHQCCACAVPPLAPRPHRPRRRRFAAAHENLGGQVCVALCDLPRCPLPSEDASCQVAGKCEDGEGGASAVLAHRRTIVLGAAARGGASSCGGRRIHAAAPRAPHGTHENGCAPPVLLPLVAARLPLAYPLPARSQLTSNRKIAIEQQPEDHN